MTGFASMARTALALGLPNIARFAGYRLGMRLGFNPVRRLRAVPPTGPFFKSSKVKAAVDAPTVSGWGSSGRLFSHWPLPLADEPPDWLVNPFNMQRVKSPERVWWQIPDFDPEVGDIKLIWELSRFNWVLAFAQRASQGDSKSLVRLNAWLTDWCIHNSPYKGPNWKCGQEASIRVLHLAMSSLILDQALDTAPGLRDLVRLHLQRIAPTIPYAMAQDNNHCTSEAAALFIGGSWLAALGLYEAERWALAGRRWLEHSAGRLIGPQGSFSQHSLNYHRIMLDTLCMAEVWRRHLRLPAFSDHWQSRALAATEWLWQLVSPVNGDGPNLGANDGAHVLQLSNTPYRDYRPTVQLAMALFARQRAYWQSGAWDHPLFWLRIDLPQKVSPPRGSYLADDGGFAVLRRGSAMALLHYPRFRFRPSQADALHLDLWLGGDNLLRDAGTYSYNCAPELRDYFCGTGGHNTVQFDGRDQMPRISRFLLGDWLQTEYLSPFHEDNTTCNIAAGYRDRQGARHHRSVSLQHAALRVTDAVEGFSHQAVLRWRLLPGDWRFERSRDGGRLTLSGDREIKLNLSANVPVTRCELVEGWESRHYLEKTLVPVLEIEIQQAGRITTELQWTI